MKTIRFRTPSTVGDYHAYFCSEPGDQSGEYVRAEVAVKLIAALRWARTLVRDTSDLAREIDDAIAEAEPDQ